MILGTYESSKTILSSKQQFSCKSTYLLKQNYLSEFATKSEKEKVLRNLGIINNRIPINVAWGEIVGNVTDQKDLDIFLKKNEVQNLQYTNVTYSSIFNVKEALDQALQGSIQQVETLEDRDNIDYATPGTLCYVQETDQYFKLTADNSWELFNSIGELSADKVSYTNQELGVENVKQALDAIISLLDSGTSTWKYTFTCNPSTAYYGTQINVVYSYNMISEVSDLKVEFDGISSTKKSGSITKTLTAPASVTLKATSSLGTINKTISPNFVFKGFYCLSQNETYNNEELKELVSNSVIDCGDEEYYIYCIIHSDSIIIKDPNFGLEDSGAFIKQEEITLPKGTFANQIYELSGYKVFRSSNKLTGKWTIKI